MKNQFIIGARVYLRAIAKSDLTEEYQNWFNDEEVCKHNSHHRFPNYRENMEEYFRTVISSKNNLILGIIDKETDKHIGNIALQCIDSINRNAELAIIVGDKEYWGKGVGKEAAALIVNHGFNQLNLYRIYCATSEDNIAMQKLAESLGFKKEGVVRECFYKNGGYVDSINYGLLKHEYEKEKENTDNNS